MHPSAHHPTTMRPPGLATGGRLGRLPPAARIGRGLRTTPLPAAQAASTPSSSCSSSPSPSSSSRRPLGAPAALPSSTPMATTAALASPPARTPRAHRRRAPRTVLARGGPASSSSHRLSPFTELPSSASADPQHASPSTSKFDTIESALEDVRAGKFVVVLDDEDRENEGDLICAADRVTTEAMAFMVEHTSGVICVGMEGADCDRLDLPLMVASKENNECMYTAFTVTADLAEGTTTGISASDRAATLRALASRASTPGQFKRPGHIFPLRARPGGVVVRPGHTEAAVDLARLAGCAPAGALCEVVDRRDGSMARTEQLLDFSREHGLKCITIADLIRYRLRTEPETLVEPAGLAGGEDPVEAARRAAQGGVDGARRGEAEAAAEAPSSSSPSSSAGVPIDTRHGRFRAHAFRSTVDPTVEHVALVAGDEPLSASAEPEPPLACLQLQSGVVDALGSQHCGAEAGLDAALRAVAEAGAGGVVLYVRSAADGAPRGLAAELAAHARREALTCGVNGGGGAAEAAAAAANDDGRPRDLRDFAAASGMLRHLGVRSVRLLADAAALDDAAARLRATGVDVAAAVPLQRRGGGGNGNGNGNGGNGAAAVNGQQHPQVNGSAHAAGVLTAV